MNRRPAVPRNIQRRLWAESIGRCMNPDCQADLIENGVSVGDMAHINPYKDGGSAIFENLILLCKKCHTQIDAQRSNDTIIKLQSWKKNRNREIEAQFAKRYKSFDELKESVTPVLKRNGQIFDNYGPENRDTHSSERHNLWLKFEGEIIFNNQRLELVLTKNKKLFPRENQHIVDQFVQHAREFRVTRDSNEIIRFCLFPRGLLSIFDLKDVSEGEFAGFPPNLSALQNFVSHLIQTNSFVSLELNEQPRLMYIDKGENVTLMLKNRPRVQQIFWNGRFFNPIHTDVRVENLVFFAQWLYGRNIRYEFADMRDLTTLVLNSQYTVKLCYKYILSISDLHMINFKKGDIVVNLHSWNGAPVSEEARKYASQIGIRTFGQNDFFKFVYRNLM